MNNIGLLLILSIVPSLILGKIVYNYDKVEKEPLGLLLKLFLGGVLSIIITLVISFILLILFPKISDPTKLNLIELIHYSFICIALVEEGSKRFFLKKITWNNKEFNYIYDAIVYAVFVSLGFATIENIIYVLQGGILTAIMRAILSIPGHSFFGVFMGYYYGLSKQAYFNQNNILMKKNMHLSLIIPVILHGMFDYCLFSANFILVGVYFIFIIILYIRSFKKIKQFSAIEQNFME